MAKSVERCDWCGTYLVEDEYGAYCQYCGFVDFDYFDDGYDDGYEEYWMVDDGFIDPDEDWQDYM